MYNVWKRHAFLKSFIGAKQEEDASMDSCISVAIGFAVCLVVCSVLEIVFYFVFNRKVKLMYIIHYYRLHFCGGKHNGMKVCTGTDG